jgi:hypothetical protein
MIPCFVPLPTSPPSLYLQKIPFPSHFLFIFLKGKRSLSVSIAATLALPGFMKRYRRFNQSAVPPVTLSSEAI